MSGQSFAWRVAFAVLALLVLNLPLLLLSKYGSVSRPLINLDYALVLLWMTAGWRGGLLLLVMLAALDAVCGSFSTFFFRSVSEWFSAMHFGTAVGISALQPYVVAIAAGLVGCVVSWWVVQRLMSRLSWRAVLLASALLMGLDWGNGSSLLRRADQRVVDHNLGGSQLVGVAAAISPWRSRSVSETLPPEQSMLGRLHLSHLAQSPSSHGLLVVLVESWGLRAGQPPDRSPVVRALADGLARHYVAETGSVPFRGATTAAELREWCGAKAEYATVTSEWGRRCLPWRFVEAGWQTSAMHGFGSTMFERIRWWPALGFQRWQFQDLDPPRHAQECGFAFQGICDADVLAAAVEQARRPKQLVYALTLDAHLPLHDKGTPPECQAQSQRALRNACHLESIHLRMARNLISLLDDGLGPDVVAIVGDHAPPFVDSDSRAQWDLKQVPFLILRKRGS